MPPSAAPSLFYPFRALGYVSEGAPFAVQRRGTETFVTVSAGKAWQIYNCDKLRLVMVGPQFGDAPDIRALAAKGDLTFAAVGRDVAVCRRSHRLCTFEGHAESITHLFVFGGDLISVCAGGRVLAWDISKDAMDYLDGKRSAASRDANRASQAGDDPDDSDDDESDSDDSKSSSDQRSPRPREFALPHGFLPTAVCHPDTYLNKILLGAADGRLCLLNVKTGSVIHVFEPDAMGNRSGASVTCLENSPALDTVAVGLSDGRVVVHNVRHDVKVVDFGHDGSGKPVRSCAFSTGQGEPVLAVAGDSGTVSVWSLEKRRLRTLVTGAHDGAATSAHFFSGSPILMTGGADNAVKQWIFDNRDGSARLLKFRAGHSAPPTHVAFYGEGTRLLSAGNDRALRVFSTIQDQQSRELSQSHVERRAKRLKLAEQELKLPPITGMAWCETRERDWANVVTCHEGEPRAYTWRLADGVLGEHVLAPPARVGRDGVADARKNAVLCVAISACGNFAVVGTAGGDVHRYNLQSGAHRGAFRRLAKETEEERRARIAEARKPRRQLNFRGGAKSIWNMADQSHGADAAAAAAPRVPAHDGAVTAVETDGANKTLVTGGADGFARAWRFNDTTLECEMDTGCAVTKMKAHKPSGLVAVAGSDRCVRVLDTVGARRVRSLLGAKSDVASLDFSADGRWVLAATRDGAVCVWDVPAARLLQTMRLSRESPVVGLSLSPNMDVLATVHAGRRGVYLWANSQMYAPGGSEGFANRDEDEENETGAAEEVAVELPRLHADANEAEEIVLGGPVPRPGGGGEKDDGEGAKSDDAAGAKSDRAVAAEPAAPGLATMALLPRTQWMGLLNLETIRERNKPVAPPEKPEAAPFFLPTVAGLEREKVFDVSRENADDDEDAVPGSKILTTSVANGGDVEGTFLRLIRRGKAAAEAAEDRALAEGKSGGRKAKSKFKSASSNGESNGETVGGPYADVLAHLRAKGPSALDAEIRALGPWDASTMTDAEAEELEDALEFFVVEVPSGRNFELLHALLAHFLRVHGAAIQSRESLRMRADRVRDAARKTWGGTRRAHAGGAVRAGILRRTARAMKKQERGRAPSRRRGE